MEVKTIKDYYDIIQNKFPQIPKQDIIRMLNFGWKSFYLHNSYGGDVVIQDYNFWSYTGFLRKNSIYHFKYYIQKLKVKIRVKSLRNKTQYNGYYYFALTDRQYNEYTNQKNSRGRKRKKFYYGNQILYRLLEECKLINYNRKYIFKVPIICDVGITIYKKDFITDNAELIEIREAQKFKDILVSNYNYKLK